MLLLHFMIFVCNMQLERCINIAQNFSREHDVLPYRLMHERPPERKDAPDAINSNEGLDSMLDRYFELHGWDKKNGLSCQSGIGRARAWKSGG